MASQGTGGWVSGVGKFLREDNPDVRLYAVEPEECPLLSQRGWGPHGIEGIGDGFVPKALDLSQLSGIVTTTTDESVEMAQRLAREEGIFCGISSGCNVAAAIKLARRHPELINIVTNSRYGTALFHHRLVRGGKTRRDSRTRPPRGPIQRGATRSVFK